MCLIKTHRLPKISRKPIQVYKRFFNYHTNILITPYQGLCCKPGDIIKARNSWVKGIFTNEIEGEGVHAFKDYPTEIELAFIAMADVDDYYVCEIPPYTPYWIGDNRDIAASKMKIIKRL